MCNSVLYIPDFNHLYICSVDAVKTFKFVGNLSTSPVKQRYDNKQ